METNRYSSHFNVILKILRLFFQLTNEPWFLLIANKLHNLLFIIMTNIYIIKNRHYKLWRIYTTNIQ